MAEKSQFPQTITVYSRKPDASRTKLRFRLIREIGRGGMGIVFLAEDLDPPEWYLAKYGNRPRMVAVKHLMNPLGDKQSDDRFIREALVAHGIDHPNVVRVHNICVDENGAMFLIMRYVENSRTLAEVLEYSKALATMNSPIDKAQKTVVPLPQFLILLHQMLDALEAIHEAGIVHRDLKPENFLVTGSGDGMRVYLADFGIAKSVDPTSRAGLPLTMEGLAPCTPLYTSPESLVMKFRKDGDQREDWGVCKQSDFFSLGVIMYELLTGQLPFFAEVRVDNLDGTFGSSFDYKTICGMIVDDTIGHSPMSDYIDGLSASVVNLVERCLKKAPWERPSCVAELRELLDDVEEELVVSQRRAVADTVLVPVAVARVSVEVPVLEPEPESEKVVEVAVEERTSASKRFYGRFAILLVTLVVIAFFYMRSYGFRELLQKTGEVAPVASVSVPSSVASAEDSLAAPSSSPVVARSQPEPATALPGQMARTLARAELYLKRRQYGLAERESHFLLAQHPAFPPPFRIMAESAFLRKPQDMNEVRRNARAYLRFEGTSMQDFSSALRQALEASPAQ